MGISPPVEAGPRFSFIRAQSLSHGPVFTAIANAGKGGEDKRLAKFLKLRKLHISLARLHQNLFGKSFQPFGAIIMDHSVKFLRLPKIANQFLYCQAPAP